MCHIVSRFNLGLSHLTFVPPFICVHEGKHSQRLMLYTQVVGKTKNGNPYDSIGGWQMSVSGLDFVSDFPSSNSGISDTGSSSGATFQFCTEFILKLQNLRFYGITLELVYFTVSMLKQY